MKEETIKPLLIYSASAGSGKTFSLVQNYLKLILKNDFSTNNFSRIIAMTFTNKAAWEMKERIVEALDLLAYPERSTEKETKKAKQLLEATVKTIDQPEEQIRERAKSALSEILHNYEDFSVLTIDKFSLRLIRTFSRDLDLQENFEVTLDQKILLEQVIDELLSKIGKSDEKEITRLSLTYAKSKLYDGNSWNIRRDLIQFSQILTKENDQPFVDALLKQDYSEGFKNKIETEFNEINQTFKDKCSQLHDFFVSLNTSPKDYPYTSRGMFKFLNELPNYDILNFPTPNNYVLGTLDGSIVKESHNVDAQLVELTKKLLDEKENLFDKAYTLGAIRSNYYNLALLKYISNELNSYKEKENLIGIFEFGQKIASLLKKERAAYIYERLGNRYNHYLLDEFQDTSRLQWMNLVPLIDEAISKGHDNLIVGDPKQAIYRFRNGLVEQFVALPSIYNPENDKELARITSQFNQLGVKKALESNYRSKKTIVEFNNSFFKNFIQSLPQDFSEYYEDVEQNSISKSGGYVNIEFLKEEVTSEEAYKKEFEFILRKVKESINDGYKAGDICILIRSNYEGTVYAKELIKKGYKIVSSESLIVSSDDTVRLCIDYLNLRKNSRNKAIQMKFASSYFRRKGEDPLIGLSSFKSTNKSFDFNRFLIENFGGIDEFYFAYENLYDLGAKLNKLLGYNELENPYLHHLMDLFQDYDLKKGPDIRGFIDEWDAKLSKSSLQMPENDEAIKIMTIHKSKGLEFPIVIMPKLNWRVTPSIDPQFIEATDGELLYTRLSKDKGPKYLSEKYNEEYRQNFLDQLNVLYVGFTRPSERLYLYVDANLPKKKLDSYSTINQALTVFLSDWTDEFMTIRNDQEICFGEREQKEIKTESTDVHDKSDENKFTPVKLGEYIWFPELAFQDKEAKEQETYDFEKRYGNQLHLLLEKSKTSNQVDQTVKLLRETGRIDEELISTLQEEAKKVLQFLESQPFSINATTTLEEQDVLLAETKTKRIDKIYLQEDKKTTIIDFKTGEKNKEKNKKQVREYCDILKEMSFSEVEGYVLYTKDLKMEKV